MRAYDKCKKCNKPTVRMFGEGYHNDRHETITSGWYCRKCKIFYLNPTLNCEKVVIDDLTHSDIYDGKELLTSKEKLQKAMGFDKLTTKSVLSQ